MAANELFSTASGRPIDWDAELAGHGRWLRTVILARSGDPQAVEELMQDVAAAVFGQDARPVDAAKVAAWLYRIAVRQALLYRRRLGRQRRLQNRIAKHFLPTEEEKREPDPLQWLLADERRQLVRTALEQLHRRDAEILLLKYTEGWSYRELAEHLGTSPSAVEARLHRARQKLRYHLQALNVVEVPR